jgi:hypothetical protein
MKNNQVSERSSCCNAKVKVVGRTTLHYECLKCHQPCDVIFRERKVWRINPATRIVPNKKKDQKDKIAKQEIQEMGNA